MKTDQPTLGVEVEAAFAETRHLETQIGHDKGHGRIEERCTAVLRETDWLAGARRFPKEPHLPGAGYLVHAETRDFISSRVLAADKAAEAVRGHRAIKNRLLWDLDVAFAGDLCRVRKRHGARSGATVKHFAPNLLRTANDKRSMKSRRKLAGWSPEISRRS